MTSFIATKYILPVRQCNYTLDSPILGSEGDNTLHFRRHQFINMMLRIDQLPVTGSSHPSALEFWRKEDQEPHPD